MSALRQSDIRRKSGQPDRGNPNESLKESVLDLGHTYPQPCPQRYPQLGSAAGAALSEPLGTPLGIREAAQILGCSAWTVRQRYIPAGLPHHRATAKGKLVFYRNQIIRWLLTKQQKGGMAI